MKRTAIILGLIVICIGLVSCDGGGPTNTSGYPSSVLFVETWESYPVGNFPGGGWRDTPEIYFAKRVEITANHKMMLEGPADEISSNHGGIYYPFKKGTMKPSYISYKMHPYSYNPENKGLPYTSIGNFSIEGFADETNWYTISFEAVDIHFIQYTYGLGSIVANQREIWGSESNPIPIDNSFLFELKNIDWEAGQNITYDLWINGVEVESCIPFMHIKSITSINFFNQNYGRVHFDNIYMADLPLEYNCPVVSEDPPTMPLPPLPSPTEPTDPVLFIIDLPAFCRGGPSVEYPKISTYPEGTQLEITGQNIEGSWWWNQDGDCWVSDTVGDLVGDKITLDIINPPPPPPDDTDSSDGSPGKPAGCKKSLGQGACVEEGGTWDDQPGQPGTCICP